MHSNAFADSNFIMLSHYYFLFVKWSLLVICFHGEPYFVLGRKINIPWLSPYTKEGKTNVEMFLVLLISNIVAWLTCKFKKKKTETKMSRNYHFLDKNV